MQLSGFFYDGESSRQIPAQMTLDGEHVILKSTETEESWSDLAENITVRRKIAGAPREIEFPGGKLFVTRDHEILDEWLDLHSGLKNTEGWLHKLEQNKFYIFIAVIVCLSTTWFTFTYGIPALSKTVAHALPDSVSETLGKGALASMDEWFFEPTQISEDEQARIGKRFYQMAERANISIEPTLHFRASEVIGANALALPNGDIILTDDLVTLSENDDELLSILAHEIGHVEMKHGLQGVIRGSIISFIAVYVTGDMMLIEELAVALPTFILEAGYSREAEQEADDYAKELMQEEGIPLISFANIMTRLEESLKQEMEEQEGGFSLEIPTILSTHPATEERVKQFQ